MAKPTYQDATLMLQLAQWSTASGMQKATTFLWSDQFVADTVSKAAVLADLNGVFLKAIDELIDGLSHQLLRVFAETRFSQCGLRKG